MILAVSSLNSDYGVTWGGTTRPDQVKPDTINSGPDFSRFLARSMGDENEVINESTPAEETTSNEENQTRVLDIDDDTAYRRSLLDPNKLPRGLSWGDGSSSMDVIDKPVFRVTEYGNIERIDILPGGCEHLTLIPNTEGGWRLSSSGSSTLGAVYNRQVSAYEVHTLYMRGVQSRPSGYTEGQYERSTEDMLDITRTPFSDKWPKEE